MIPAPLTPLDLCFLLIINSRRLENRENSLKLHEWLDIKTFGKYMNYI